MTVDEIETCLRDFYTEHKEIPMLLVLSAEIYDGLQSGSVLAHNTVTTEDMFGGVRVLRDPLIKGIWVSS